jgi:hypothetical protein
MPVPPELAASISGSTLRVHGVQYAITPGAFEGWVDVAMPANGVGAITGWARDARLVAAVVGDHAYVVAPHEVRPDVGAAGYHLFIRPPLQHVRVFALGDGKASELNYPPGYPWR